MRHPMGTISAGLLVLGLGACAQGSAERAITAAEKAVAEVQADASKIAPAELKALTDSIAAMKAHVAAGDHRAALMGGRSVTTGARDLGSSLATRKEQLTTSFNAVAGELPAQLTAVLARIKELRGLRRLPGGIDPAKFSALAADAAGWETAWKTAADGFAAGNLSEALSQARAIATKVADARSLLGMS